MPRSSCTVCGAPALPGKTRCGLHPRAATPAQKRGYRGLAGYREMRARVLAESDVCHICGQPGADEIDHVTPYVDQDPSTRDDTTTWRPADFRPVHGARTAPHLRCNQRRGRRPLDR